MTNNLSDQYSFPAFDFVPSDAAPERRAHSEESRKRRVVAIRETRLKSQDDKTRRSLELMRDILKEPPVAVIDEAEEIKSPDHIMDSLAQVSEESGVPIEDFAYKYDESEGPMAELNRRAYALAAAAAGVRVMAAFRFPDIPRLLPHRPDRRAVAEKTAETLKLVYSSVEHLGAATIGDVATITGLTKFVVKGRMRRLRNVGLVRLVSRREHECSYIWTTTAVRFDDVFVTRHEEKKVVPLIAGGSGPPCEATAA